MTARRRATPIGILPPPLTGNGATPPASNTRCRDNITLGLAYELMDLGTARMNAQRGSLTGRIAGEFPSNLVNFVAANIKWQF